MSLTRTLSFGLGTSLLVALVACGSDPPGSTYGSNPGSGGFGGDDPSGGQNGLGNDDGNGTPDDLKACATSSATAEARPVYLVFMFDKSGSMVNNGSPKWASSVAATKAFFSAPESKGISASLTFFPSNPFFFCSADEYSSPEVPMTALPSATFGQMLDAQSPNGGTPTLPALEGAITYAKQVAQGPAKDGKVAVVLVTDGFPEGCDGNSIGSVKQLAQSVAATHPTYVIGVGNLLTNLNEIAAGGGTKSALIVADNNPSQIQADFQNAIQTIKNSALSCDYKIPAPPNGEQLDTTKVNVVYKPGGTTSTTTLQHNQSCAGGTGWKYDDAQNPTRIVVCDGSCDQIKSKPGAVDVLFGCKTQTGPVK